MLLYVTKSKTVHREHIENSVTRTVLKIYIMSSKSKGNQPPEMDF